MINVTSKRFHHDSRGQKEIAKKELLEKLG